MHDAYKAHKPGVKECIVDMALNGSAVRGTVRVLKVVSIPSQDLKKLTSQVINPCLVAFVEIEVVCETNEQWALLGNK